MKRKDIIQAKARSKNVKQTIKAMKHLNAGLVLLTAGATLSQVAIDEPLVVQAQSTRLSKSDFLGLITDYAKQIASENDLYASVMIAQAALESGWGNSTLSQAPNYNLFGIKGEYNGNTVVKDTLEDDGSGNYYGIKDGFRKYDNYGQSLTDYASLLTGDDDPNNWRYNFYYGTRVSSTNSYEDATKYLTGRYATDTRYGDKLNRIITQNNLTRYDITSNDEVVETPTQEVEEKPVEKPIEASKSVYTVKAGDGYWGIARKYGTTVEALKALNGATSNLIHPGQVLKLPTTAVIEPNTPDTGSDNASSNNADSSTSSSYTIQRGDGLYSIARKYGMTLAQLKSLNGLTSDLIHPGQVLKVSTSTQVASQATLATSSEAEVNSQVEASAEQAPTEQVINTTEQAVVVEEQAPATTNEAYTVQAGDTLYSIAQRNGLDVYQLIEQNKGSSNILVGQSIDLK